MNNGKVVLIRHADFIKPVTGGYYGWTDQPLSENGRAQAQRLRARLEAQGVVPDALYCSDLIRCRETAAIALPEVNAAVDAGLREINFGAWEGKRYADIMHLPEYAHFADTGEAPGGESSAAFYARIESAFRKILAAHENQLIAIVAHAGPIRVMIARSLGLEFDENWRFSVGLASVSTIVFADGFGYLKIE